MSRLSWICILSNRKERLHGTVAILEHAQITSFFFPFTKLDNGRRQQYARQQYRDQEQQHARQQYRDQEQQHAHQQYRDQEQQHARQQYRDQEQQHARQQDRDQEQQQSDEEQVPVHDMSKLNVKGDEGTFIYINHGLY